MQTVIAVIVIVILGAGTFALTRPTNEATTATTGVETRIEDIAKDDTELAEVEDTNDEPEDIPLTDPVAAEPETPEPVVSIPATESVVATPQPEPVVVTPEPEPAVVASTYADGTYNASANYRSPGGTHSTDITITLENDVVTAATFSSNTKNSTSKKYVSRFADAHKAQVIGRDLDEISLSRVGGASLTTNGYNDALDILIAKAAN